MAEWISIIASNYDQNLDLPDLWQAVHDDQPNDCPAQTTHPGWPLVCCRATGHPLGRHIALGTRGVMAAWPGDHEPTLADLGVKTLPCGCPPQIVIDEGHQAGCTHE